MKFEIAPDIQILEEQEEETELEPLFRVSSITIRTPMVRHTNAETIFCRRQGTGYYDDIYPALRAGPSQIEWRNASQAYRSKLGLSADFQ
jgi:hypothetical protein